jgi:hypothetical protein
MYRGEVGLIKSPQQPNVWTTLDEALEVVEGSQVQGNIGDEWVAIGRSWTLSDLAVAHAHLLAVAFHLIVESRVFSRCSTSSPPRYPKLAKFYWHSALPRAVPALGR